MDDFIDLDNDNICGICYAEFLDVDDLKLHIIQYHLNETSKYRFCDFCARIFSDVEAYSLHLRNSHLTSFKVCKFCTRVYNDVHTLLRHEKKHKSRLYHPKVACSSCIKVFKNKRELETHEYERHRENGDGFMLQHCFPELSSLININIRKFFKGLHQNYLYRCVVCELSTTNVSDYMEHLLKDKCKSVSCNTCCNVYAWKSRLAHHCKTHKQTVNKEYGKRKCPKCDQFFYYTKLKSHIKDCTTMKCIPCDILFDSVEKFANHVTTHTRRTPVQFENCKYCRRPFIGRNILEKHIERSHKHNLHLYKYKCSYCDIFFKHPKLLFGHFFTKHRDINPYTCKICNKDYRIRKNFTLHIKLDHKSVGFVEFDSNYHVFFTDKKSDKPFQPRNPDMPERDTHSDQEMTIDKENNAKTDTIEEIDNENILDVSKDTDDGVKNKDIAIESVDDDEDVVKNTTEATAKNESTPNNDETTSKEDDGLNKTKSCDNTKINYEDVMETNVATEEINLDQNKTDFNGREVNIKLVNVNSDFMTITETDADQTESELKKQTKVQRLKMRTQPVRSRKRPRIKTGNIDSNSSDDSDLPLSKIVKKRSRRVRKIKRRKTSKEIAACVRKKMKFVCFVCERNCYTYQNYHRHMSLHMKNGKKICVKCFSKFETKDELNNHMEREHSSSKLTETLRKILDKRKNKNVTNETPAPDNIFTNTIQKVPIEVNDVQATITIVENDKLSVKKFLETFKPDTNDPCAKKISISNSLSIRPVMTGETKTSIKMTKFKPEQNLISHRPQLKMPVEFKQEPRQDHKVTIKLVYSDYVAPTLNFHSETVNTDFNKPISYSPCLEESSNDDVQSKTVAIPEVGQEVLLEEKSTGKVNFLKKSIVLKDLLSYNNVRIGHLAPKAPYYKIVTIDEVLHEKQHVTEPPKPVNLTLPNGTKLVSVNPLAHLLGNKTVADIPKSNPYKNKSYSYKSKMQDFGQAIVKAMKILDKAPVKKKSTKKIDSVKQNVD